MLIDFFHLAFLFKVRTDFLKVNITYFNLKFFLLDPPDLFCVKFSAVSIQIKRVPRLFTTGAFQQKS